MDEPLPPVSVLIVNFNGSKFLGPCLRSLLRTDYPSYEVIVVDNASTDNSLEILEQFPGVKVVRSDRNLGFAGGNNLGLGECRGKYVLLLNNDTEVTESFMGPLVKYLEQRPEVGIVQSKMFLPRFNGTLDACGSFLTRTGFLYHYGYYKKDADKYEKSYPVFTAKGACMMFRRSLVHDVGGHLFNGNFFCYYEETDFCHRAWIAGFETHFVPESVIQHYSGGTSKNEFAEAFPFRQYVKNQTFSLLSNLSRGSLVRILPVYFVMLLAGTGASLLFFRFSLSKSYFEAMLHPLRHFGSILEQRKQIKKIRRVSDRKIFEKVMMDPRPDYFLKTFSGKLASYQDAPVENFNPEKVKDRR